MTQLAISGPAPRPYFRAGALALAVLTMTSVHHAYGAVIYDTPWRLHIVFVAVPAALMIVIALRIGAARQGTTAGRVATILAILVIAILPVGLIGFVEGGYNHVIKNIAYGIGGEAGMRMLFPDWLYGQGSVETPNDFVFELTGIAQFPLSIMALAATWRLRRVF